MKNKTIAMCLLALAAAAGNAFAVGEARLTGKITDAVTKAPLPNATITLVSTGGRNFKGEYKAEKDGLYRILVLDGVRVGRQVVVVDARDLALGDHANTPRRRYTVATRSIARM